MSEACQLNEGPFYQCCCNCRHHWQDFHHCTIDTAMREAKGGCVCGVPKGWICVGMRIEMDGAGPVHSGWAEHSVGCEMYQPVKLYPRPTESGTIREGSDG